MTESVVGTLVAGRIFGSELVQSLAMARDADSRMRDRSEGLVLTGFPVLPCSAGSRGCFLSRSAVPAFGNVPSRYTQEPIVHDDRQSSLQRP